MIALNQLKMLRRLFEREKKWVVILLVLAVQAKNISSVTVILVKFGHCCVKRSVLVDVLAKREIEGLKNGSR